MYKITIMLEQIQPNPNKRLYIDMEGKTYARYPIKTHLISKGDDITEVVKKYALSLMQEDDILVISERVIAVLEGRSFLLEEIKPGFFAHQLSKYVFKHPGGIGLRNPYTMQLAIQEAGLFRILFAAFVSIVTKAIGIRGIFYRIAGHNVNAIDGPCPYTLPPGNKSVKLGPKDPMKTAKTLNENFGIHVAIIDANDYGVRVIGYSNGLNKKNIKQAFRDNPFGQERQQTPMAVLRCCGETREEGSKIHLKRSFTTNR
jgi:hypothetical protein